MQFRRVFLALTPPTIHSMRVHVQSAEEAKGPGMYFVPNADFAQEANIERSVEINKLNGNGYCPSGLIEEPEGQYLAEGVCVQACVRKPQCQAISFCPPDVEACGPEGKCHRYENLCSDEELINEGDAGPHFVSYSKRPFQSVTLAYDHNVKELTDASYRKMKEYLAEKLPNGGNVAVVSMLAAFAPVTKAHVNNFIKSREKLVQKGYKEVLGVMSFKYPERADWNKLNSRGEPNIPFFKRHELADCAFNDAQLPWMFTEFKQTWHYEVLTQEPELRKYDFQLFMMNGADDVYHKMLYRDCGKEFPDGRKFIMVGRPGDTDDIQHDLQRRGISGEDEDCLWIDNYNSFSSSMLRDAAIAGSKQHVYDIADRCVAVFMNGPYLTEVARHNSNLKKKVGTRRAVMKQKDGYPEVIIRDENGAMAGTIVNGAAARIVGENDENFKVKFGRTKGWVKKYNVVETFN